jgi:hypothetical protein
MGEARQCAAYHGLYCSVPHTPSWPQARPGLCKRPPHGGGTSGPCSAAAIGGLWGKGGTNSLSRSAAHACRVAGGTVASGGWASATPHCATKRAAGGATDAGDGGDGAAGSALLHVRSLMSVQQYSVQLQQPIGRRSGGSASQPASQPEAGLLVGQSRLGCG